MIIICIMTLLSSMANAQIKKTGSYKAETIASSRMGFVNLKVDNKGYYLTIPTTNEFDDSMILKLGATKDAALQSLKDLIDVFDSLLKNEMQKIDNGFGEEFRLYKNAGALYIHADGYAGMGNLSKSELKKFIKALQGEKTSQKTNEKFPDPLYQ